MGEFGLKRGGVELRSAGAIAFGRQRLRSLKTASL